MTDDARRTVDYDAARRLYVEGREGDDGHHWPTLDEVASVVGCSATSLRNRSAAEKWSRQRRQHRQAIEGMRAQERIGNLRERLEAMDDKAMLAADVGLELVGLRLRELASQMQYRDAMRQRSRMTTDDGTELEVVLDDSELPSVDIRELEVLARAASAWHTLGEKAAGAGPETRIEITGAGGVPLETDGPAVTEVLERDDPDRLASVIDVLQRSGQFALAGSNGHSDQDAGPPPDAR